jgi:hypothetical protein
VVTAYPEGVKEFVVYTLMRIVLFLASVVVVFAAWFAIAGKAPITGVVIVGFVVSGIASYFLLNRQRAAFAVRVEERARRATARFDEMKAREDVDEQR